MTYFTYTIKELVNEIADLIKANNTGDAYYLAEVLVADYGTHYISEHGYGGKLSMDLYLSASYLLQIESKQEITNNSRKLFNTRFNVEEVTEDYSYEEFERNVKQVKVDTIGASILPAVGSGSNNAWQIMMSQFDKSKAVIMRDQEPISSLLDHTDFGSISLITRRKIKQFLDDTCREYVKRNSFKVIYDLKLRVRLKYTKNWP
jgi:hypothetical protein